MRPTHLLTSLLVARPSIHYLAPLLLFSSTIIYAQDAPGGIMEKSNPYPYKAVDGGIEITNGQRRFNRPLYSSVERPYRLVALAGDRPDFALLELQGKGSLSKLANLTMGFTGESWLSQIEPINTCAKLGVQSYRIGEGANVVLLDAVRALDFDGLLLRVQRAGTNVRPMVFAIGGRASGAGAEFGVQESNMNGESSAASFRPGDCKGTILTFADNLLTLADNGKKKKIPVYATSSVPLKFKTGDANMIVNGPDKLLESAPNAAPVGILTADWPKSGVVFLLLTADDPNSAAVKAFRAKPEDVFAQAVEDNRSVANTIQISTPDPYFNAAMPAVLLSYNATWNDPVFCHGAVSWHSPYAGWRNTYGATSAGWHERVQKHMHAFYGKQLADGRIPSMLESDEIYNMGEVLMDQALYDWEWTGDLKPLRDGGFDAIARHLEWGEKNMKTPQGLYENFLNAWNTDYKWCNGGGGTIASAYYWRANKIMADIATRLGKNPSVFNTRAREIAAAMKTQLWSERAGVYGEYRDRFGNQLLHESPDLSSIYTPIYLGISDPFESYRMLRFALRRFEAIDGLPRDGKLLYCSEWLPNHYSTRGLYPQEIIDALFAMYLTGQSEAAEPFRRAIDGSFFAGPGPGSTGLHLQPDGRYIPPTDFTDPLSLYLRNVVAGVFGIQKDAPNRKIVLQPSFPLDWKTASIVSPAVSYAYTWDGVSEGLRIKNPTEFALTVRLRARCASITKAVLDGKPVEYSVEPGIGCAWIVIKAPGSTSAQVNVTYAKEELAVLESPTVGIPGEALTVRTSGGRITELRDSAGGLSSAKISDDAKQFTAQLPKDAGVYTFFLLLAQGNVRFWVPVEVDVKAKEEHAPVSDATLTPAPVNLDKFCNQRLTDLHKMTYGPLIDEFYWVKKAGWMGQTGGSRTVKPNGRSWWEERKDKVTSTIDTSVLDAAGGRIVASNNIPFIFPAKGNNAVFTSLYDNFPERVEIPVKMRGRKMHFLVTASISTAQSRMENGRITAVLGDGTRRALSLRDPENIDDWLGSGSGTPYVQSGRVQKLGNRTHAVLNEIDFGEEQDIASVILETRTNETMIGLLGVTVMQSGK